MNNFFYNSLYRHRANKVKDMKNERIMKMKKLLLMAGIIALVSATPVFADETVDAGKPQTLPCPIEKSIKIKVPECGRPQRMHKPPHFDIKKFEDELGLTDKQKAQAKEIRQKSFEKSKPIFEQIRVKEKEIKELKKELREIRVQSKKDFEAILTNKQLKKLETMKQERKQKFEGRRRPGMHHKRPPMRPGCPCPKQPTVEK